MKFNFLMCVNASNPFIDLAIQSVLNQSDPEFEFYIIANDCDDALWSYLSTLADPRLKIHRTLIGQLSFNLNYGVNLIKSGYILRMDSDDISLPDRLHLTKQALHKLDYPDVLGGQAIIIDSSGEAIGVTKNPTGTEEIRRALWKKNPMTHPSCALYVPFVVKSRGYLGGFMSEDYDLWLRASRSKNFRVVNLDEPLIKYRINDGQSRGNALAYAELAGYMLREFLLFPTFKGLFAIFIAVLKRTFLSRKELKN